MALITTPEIPDTHNAQVDSGLQSAPVTTAAANMGVAVVDVVITLPAGIADTTAASSASSSYSPTDTVKLPELADGVSAQERTPPPSPSQPASITIRVEPGVQQTNLRVTGLHPRSATTPSQTADRPRIDSNDSRTTPRQTRPVVLLPSPEADDDDLVSSMVGLNLSRSTFVKNRDGSPLAFGHGFREMPSGNFSYTSRMGNTFDTSKPPPQA
ncbi:hypothetical protein HK405_006711, partial [Cladochytrium tenue]